MAHGENHKKILLISDNQIDGHKMQRQFMDTGGMECILYISPTVDDALKYFTEKKLAMDIIILDLRLKNVGTPEEMYQTIAAAAPKVPIIALTGGEDIEVNLSIPVIAAGASGQTDRAQFMQLNQLISKTLFGR